MLSIAARSILSRHVGTHVALWGSCDPTIWRIKVLIPWLMLNYISFYNPQRPNYDESLAAVYAKEEANAAELSLIHFIVIDSMTRALVSLGEFITFLFTGKVVIPVIQFIEAGTEIDGQVISVWEAEVINESRRKIYFMLRMLGIPVFETVEEAMLCIEDAILHPSRYRISDMSDAAKVLKYQYEDRGVMHIILPSDPDSAVEEMIDALILSHFYCGEMIIRIPSSDHWLGQELSDGTPIEGRRLKDWQRITRPYFAKFAELANDKLEIEVID